MKVFISDTNVIAKIVLFNTALGGKCLISLLEGTLDLVTISVISEELDQWKNSDKKKTKFILDGMDLIEKMRMLSQAIELDESLTKGQILIAKRKIQMKEKKLKGKGVHLSRQADDGDIEIIEIAQKKKYGLISSDRTVLEVGRDCGIEMLSFGSLIEIACSQDLITNVEFEKAIDFIENTVKDGFLAEDKVIIDKILNKINS